MGQNVKFKIKSGQRYEKSRKQRRLSDYLKEEDDISTRSAVLNWTTCKPLQHIHGFLKFIACCEIDFSTHCPREAKHLLDLLLLITEI